jgi:hypothetical protein
MKYKAKSQGKARMKTGKMTKSSSKEENKESTYEEPIYVATKSRGKSKPPVYNF